MDESNFTDEIRKVIKEVNYVNTCMTAIQNQRELFYKIGVYEDDMLILSVNKKLISILLSRSPVMPAASIFNIGHEDGVNRLCGIEFVLGTNDLPIMTLNPKYFNEDKITVESDT